MSARFEEIARRWLDVVTSNPPDFMCRCPFHGYDKTPSLQFNVEKGLFVCFTCHEGGTAKTLVRRLGGTYSDPSVSVKFLRESVDRMLLKHKHEDTTQILPESYLARFKGPLHEYWESRGFDEKLAEKWGLGYDPLTDRCTIAFRSVECELLGVIQRRLDDVFPRYLYPKSFDRSGSLFGSWEVAKQSGTVCTLAEGATDVLRFDQASVVAAAQYGSSIHQKQVRLLRQLGVREVVLFYDYDNAGRSAERQAAKNLDGFILRRVKWDQNKYCWHHKLCGCGNHNWWELAKCEKKILCKCGRKHKMDPGQLPLREIRSMYENATIWKV